MFCKSMLEVGHMFLKKIVIYLRKLYKKLVMQCYAVFRISIIMLSVSSCIVMLRVVIPYVIMLIVALLSVVLP